MCTELHLLFVLFPSYYSFLYSLYKGPFIIVTIKSETQNKNMKKIIISIFCDICLHIRMWTVHDNFIVEWVLVGIFVSPIMRKGKNKNWWTNLELTIRQWHLSFHLSRVDYISNRLTRAWTSHVSHSQMPLS